MNLFKSLVLISSIGLFLTSCSDKKEVKEVKKEVIIKETVQSPTGITAPIIIAPVVTPGTTGL